MLKGFRGLLFVFLAATGVVLMLVYLAPVAENRLLFPSDMQKLSRLADEVLVYRNKHPYWSLLLFAAVYIYKQAFIIPGSFILNLLSGAVYGPVLGSLLSCLLSTTGSSCCFLLSSIFAKDLVHACFPAQLDHFQSRINGPQRLLLLLSTRIFPFTPHWLINICSPFVGIPLRVHMLTVAVGLLPYNVLCVRAGSVLYRMRSMNDVFSPTTLLNLLFIAVALLALSCARRKADGLPSHHRTS